MNSDSYASAPTRSVFDMSELLESINDGVTRFDTDQMFPISGNVSNSVVGTGTASGTTTFQFSDKVGWWSPQQSYFNLRLKFTQGASSVINNNQNILGSGAGDVPVPANPDFVTYCDNFVCTLFTQIQSFVNSQPLDIVTTPWIIDTALGYSKAHWNFIKTYASMTRMGEPLTTRLLNVSENHGVLEVAFRPCLSLFDVKLLPPGAQFRFDFIWASSALNAFESLLVNPIVIGTSAGEYQITVQDFSFYKTTLQPAPSVSLPPHGMIDLCPSVANQYYATNATTYQQNITLPPTTNRILIVWQDMQNTAITAAADATHIRAPANNITGVGGGYTPATSFTTIFTKNNPTIPNPAFGADTVFLTQLYIVLPELQIQAPRPQYTFDVDNKDYIRAYSDWANICQGTHDNMEGSLPFGNNDPSKGIAITAAAAGAIASNINSQPGDPANYQSLWNIYTPSAATSVAATTLNQISRWGWSGTRPGPIFAFPVVRPDYKRVTAGNLYANFSGAVGSAAATIIATYSMTLSVEHAGNGLYSYSLIEGV